MSLTVLAVIMALLVGYLAGRVQPVEWARVWLEWQIRVADINHPVRGWSLVVLFVLLHPRRAARLRRNVMQAFR